MEGRTNFGVLCVTSSPLILGMDVTKPARVERVWEILSNEEAIAVNQLWSGNHTQAIISTATTPNQMCVDAWMRNPLTMEPCTGNVSQQFVYLLRGICMHNFDPQSGKLWLCHVYIFPGVGTTRRPAQSALRISRRTTAVRTAALTFWGRSVFNGRILISY